MMYLGADFSIDNKLSYWHNVVKSRMSTFRLFRRFKMVQLRPLDPQGPIFQQLEADVSPVILVNIFQVAPDDVPSLLKAWEHDANWMKQQPGFLSTQLHQGIAGSTVLMNY